MIGITAAIAADKTPTVVGFEGAKMPAVVADVWGKLTRNQRNR